MSGEAAKTIGVLGAGLMGAGIAQLAAQSGARTLLFDPIPEALERGPKRISDALGRRVEKGKLSADEAEAIVSRVEPTGELAGLGPCDLVIEAAPERLDLKLELLESVAAHVDATCVIATNTSSLSVTELASAVPAPERVVGLHFFNPPAAMRLIELVAGAESAPEALARARATGEAMGKHVIDAVDIAGFLVNRCNRPYSLEGAASGGGSDRRRGDHRPGAAARRRLSDGPVRAHGPGRPRDKPRGRREPLPPELRRAPLPPERAPIAHGGRRPPGPQVGSGLV